MNWTKLIALILGAIPAVVQGVEAVQKAAAGGEKKQAAMQILGLSSAVAQMAAPEFKPVIEAATATAACAIDGVVATLNAAGEMGHKAPQAATAGQ